RVHRDRLWSSAFGSRMLDANARAALFAALPPPDLLATFLWLFPAGEVTDDRRSLWGGCPPRPARGSSGPGGRRAAAPARGGPRGLRRAGARPARRRPERPPARRGAARSRTRALASGAHERARSCSHVGDRNRRTRRSAMATFTRVVLYTDRDGRARFREED